MTEIKCPECGHLKVFHHGNEHHVVSQESSCSKESLSGCHFTIEIDKDKCLECDCNKNY
jgi:hypothetical protein